jgi:endonuclease/exonuclease/phosphatase family metal-dependent hydrolase
MRVVTWNVWWRFGADWLSRQDRILDELAGLQPDLVGLQECWGGGDGRTQAHELAAALGLHAAFAAPSLPPAPNPPETPDQRGVEVGVGLLSRWPIVGLAEHRLPARARDVRPVALAATVAAPGGDVAFVVSCVEWEPSFAADHLAQTTELARIVEAADPARPVVLAADLNAPADGPELAPLLDVLVDTWAVGRGDPGAATLSSANRYAPRAAVKQLDRRIDHVLARPGLRQRLTVDGVRLAGTDPDKPPSDHYAVVADLRF